MCVCVYIHIYQNKTQCECIVQILARENIQKNRS